MPGTTWPVNGHPPGSSRDYPPAPVLMPANLFRHVNGCNARLPDPRLTREPGLFPHRSPRQSSANAAVGGLKPPPAGRLRRANNPSSPAQHRPQKLTYHAPFDVRDTRGFRLRRQHDDGNRPCGFLLVALIHSAIVLVDDLPQPRVVRAIGVGPARAVTPKRRVLTLISTFGLALRLWYQPGTLAFHPAARTMNLPAQRSRREPKTNGTAHTFDSDRVKFQLSQQHSAMTTRQPSG